MAEKLRKLNQEIAVKSDEIETVKRAMQNLRKDESSGSDKGKELKASINELEKGLLEAELLKKRLTEE